MPLASSPGSNQLPPPARRRCRIRAALPLSVQELCVDPQHFESKTLLPNVQYLWWMDAGALCGSPTFRKQNTVTKCAISVVDGGAVFEAKQTTRQTIVIDNYDSFTYNLCQYMGDVGSDFEVYCNDDITVDEIKKISPRGIFFSPGPGTPQDSGISFQAVKDLGSSIPFFGVYIALDRHLEGRLSVLSLWSCAWERFPCSL